MGKTNLIAEPGKQEFTVTRTFDAPVSLVYRAYTEPDLLRQWLGPARYTYSVLQMDVRPGGSYRWVQHDAAGNEYSFRGVVHSVEPHKRIVQTFEFEGVPGHVSLEEAIFEDQRGQTKVTTHAVYQSVADRDGMIGSGMEDGMNEGYDRLDELLKEIQTERAPGR
jgi:uncharacterized protein YndB with AHSA1/START domain